ncbi:sag-related sequence srs17b [Cystoisospora suis]|uniref:Sag-related sequence srs17b n=1 Tax=Cystoisospora suis TaxID=483139 RepID=A0A2C6KX78_9APIC|nr:sag-related sequence srs17b [Cystoisospora suis]
MVGKQCLRSTVKLALCLSASSLHSWFETVDAISQGIGARGGEREPATKPVVDLDPTRLPILLDASVLNNISELPEPHECKYSAGTLNLTLQSPMKGATFRCEDPEDLISPVKGEEMLAYQVGNDGACDTSNIVTGDDWHFRFGVVPSTETKKQYAAVVGRGWSIAEDRQLCYVCTSKIDANKKCNVIVTIPQAQLTNEATCEQEGSGVLASFKADGSDLSVTLTCPSGQTLSPAVDEKQAYTGDLCQQTAPLDDISPGATLTDEKTKGGEKQYKLKLKSLPEQPRLFCYQCKGTSTTDATKSCDLYIYAPTQKKGRDGGTDTGSATMYSPASPLVYVSVLVLAVGLGNSIFL